MTTIALLVLLVAVPTGIIGAVCMIRLGRDLDRESERGFTLPENKGEREQLHAARSLKLCPFSIARRHRFNKANDRRRGCENTTETYPADQKQP